METGIYKIQNTVNMKCYIGSAAIRFSKRFSQHRHMLRKGTHHNKHLQASWNKYGEESFIFVKLYKCQSEECLEWEQFFLNFYIPEYNFCRVAGSSKGVIVREETKQKLSEHFAKPYLFIDPNGKIVEGKNLKKFCKELNLSVSDMHKVLTSRRPSYKGYTANFDNYLKLKYYGKCYHNAKPPIEVISPDGKVFKVFNRTKFFREFVVEGFQASFNELLNNKIKEYKGWRLK